MSIKVKAVPVEYYLLFTLQSYFKEEFVESVERFSEKTLQRVC